MLLNLLTYPWTSCCWGSGCREAWFWHEANEISVRWPQHPWQRLHLGFNGQFRAFSVKQSWWKGFLKSWLQPANGGSEREYLGSSSLPPWERSVQRLANQAITWAWAPKKCNFWSSGDLWSCFSCQAWNSFPSLVQNMSLYVQFISSFCASTSIISLSRLLCTIVSQFWNALHRGGAIQFCGTKQHHDKWLEITENFLVQGCFAMTELGHGSNVRSILLKSPHQLENVRFF